MINMDALADDIVVALSGHTDGATVEEIADALDAPRGDIIRALAGDRLRDRVRHAEDGIRLVWRLVA